MTMLGVAELMGVVVVVEVAVVSKVFELGGTTLEELESELLSFFGGLLQNSLRNSGTL